LHIPQELLKEHGDWEKASSPFPSIHITASTPNEISTLQKPVTSAGLRLLWHSAAKLTLRCCSSVHWLFFFPQRSEQQWSYKSFCYPPLE